MSENFEFINAELPAKAKLSMCDFLCDNQYCVVSEYLSLSISRLEDHIQIRITTTHANPVTYTAVIPNRKGTDLSAVKFVMQRGNLPL